MATILRVLVTDSSAPFEPIGNLSEDLIPTAMQVTSFCGKFLTFDGNHTYFNWVGFMLNVIIEAQKGSDLTTDKINMTRFTQHTQSVSTLCNNVSSWLGSNFNVSIDTRQLYAIIENVFTNLKEVSNSSGFLDFDSERELANSAWEYRVLFALSDPNNPDRFQVLVVTITVWANIVEKTSWWGLSSSTEKNFGADVIGVVLGVEKGFRNPLA